MLSAAEKAFVFIALSVFCCFRLEEPWNSVAPIILALIQFSYLLYLQRCWKAQGIKFASYIPLWGNLNAWSFGNETHEEMMSRWIEKLGVCFGYFQDDIPAICISDADLVMEILKDKTNFVNGIANKTLHPDYVGNMLSHLHDQEWYHNRNLMIRWFKSKNLRQQIPKVTTVCRNLMGDIQSTLDTVDSDKPIEIKKMLFPYVLDMMARCITDQSIDYYPCFEGFERDDATMMDEKHRNDFAGLFPVTTWILQSLNLFHLLPKTEMKLASGLCKRLDEASKETLNSEGEPCNGFLHYSLDCLKVEKERKNQNWKEVKLNHLYSHVFMFLTRSKSTLTYGICHVMFDLAKNPEYQRKCRKEAEAYFENCSSTVTVVFSEIFKYQRACINETLRLHPAVFRLSRKCGVDNFTLSNGIHLPNGCILDLMIAKVLKSDKYFKQADKFIPERCMNKASLEEARRSGTYLQFGIGQRQCPADMFSLLCINLVLSHILMKYEIRLESADQELGASSATMIEYIYDEIPLILIPRDQ